MALSDAPAGSLSFDEFFDALTGSVGSTATGVALAGSSTSGKSISASSIAGGGTGDPNDDRNWRDRSSDSPRTMRDITNGSTPNLGQKLNFLFGQATGSTHNIQRSLDMLRQLNSIGILDNPASRTLIYHQIVGAFNQGAATAQQGGRHMVESLLMGPTGGLIMQTVWQNNNLITIILRSGPSR